MTKKQIKRIIYLYIGIGALAVLGLNVTIKTIALNQKMIKLQKQILQLKEENRDAQYQLLQANSLSNLETIATEKLNMIPPKQIDYLIINPKHNATK